MFSMLAVFRDEIGCFWNKKYTFSSSYQAVVSSGDEKWCGKTGQSEDASPLVPCKGGCGEVKVK